MHRDRPRLPGPLWTAISAVLLQAAVLLGLAVVEVASLTTERVTMAVSTTLFFVLVALALLACGWGLSRRSSWARSPVVLAQLISIALAWSFREGSTAAVSIALSVVAVAALVGVLAPSSTAALSQDDV